MQNKPSITIIAACTPEEYEKIFTISEDRDQMDKDWAQWRQGVNEKKAEIALQDVEYVEQFIDAEGLLQYCLREGMAVDAQARANYANLLYEIQRSEAVMSSDKFEEEEHPKTPMHSYTPPVDKLLTYTSIKEDDPLPEGISYVEKFGIGKDDVPELICMATDDYLVSKSASEFEFAAPLHAVRALAELHAEEAIEPLLTIYGKTSQNDHDWLLEILMDVFTIIGPAALPSLEQFLVDPSQDDSAQNYISEIIGRIGKEYPETRTACIAMIIRRLTDFEENDPDLNAFLIGELLEMKAVEAAPLIEEALASDCVNETWCGDWDEAQYKLGLKERPAKEERSSILSAPSIPAQSTTTLATKSVTNTLVHKSTKKSAASKKGKSKMAKASRKANRKKK